MSFVKTLAKVALGVAIAKGASYVAKKGLPKRGSGGSTPHLGGSGICWARSAGCWAARAAAAVRLAG
ncbi:hypothetical protein ACFSHQ_13685 [Gemmobacter lanyuensis]